MRTAILSLQDKGNVCKGLICIRIHFDEPELKVYGGVADGDGLPFAQLTAVEVYAVRLDGDMPPRSVYNVALRRFHLRKRIFAYGERYLLRKPICPCGIPFVQVAPKYAELRAGQYELFVVCAYLFYLKAVLKRAVLYVKRIQPFAAEAIAFQISFFVYGKFKPIIQRLISFGRSSFFYVVAAGVQSGEQRHAGVVGCNLLYH